MIVRTADIVKCQSEGNYTEFVLSDKTKKLANGNLKHFEDMLSEHNIVRVHRQYMVNLEHIHSYLKKGGGMITLSNGDVVYVGDTWREGFEKVYHEFFCIG